MDARRQQNHFRRMPYLRGSDHNCCVAPGDAADLTNYLLVIISHNLVTPGGPLWELARYLIRFAAREPWSWVEEEHQWRLHTLQEASGVWLTVKGPFCAAAGRLLRPRPTPYQMLRTKPTANRKSTAPPPAATRDADVSDACSVNRCLWVINIGTYNCASNSLGLLSGS